MTNLDAKTEKQKKDKNTVGFFSSMGRFTKGNVHLIVVSAIFMLLVVMISYIVPQITRITIDSILGDKELPSFAVPIINLLGGVEYLSQNLYIIAFVFVGLIFFQGIFIYFRRITSTQCSERVSKIIKDNMYEHIEKLPFSWHSSVSTGDIIQRSTQDSDLVKRYVGAQFVEMFRILFMLSVSITLMMIMNVKMTLIALILLPIIVLFSTMYFPRISKLFKDVDEAEGVVTAALQENLTGLRVVRAFGQQAAEYQKFTKKTEEYTNMWHRFSGMLSLFWGSGDFFAALQTLIILVAGAVMVINNELSIGELLVFLHYNQMLIWPLRNIGRILAETGKAKISLQRLVEVLDAVPETDSPDEQDVEIKGNVSFKNVSFSYDGTRQVLDDISFDIEKGKVFAIIGTTGSGKSTLVQLINRLYENYTGDILLDGVNIRNIKRSTLRKNIGLILQEPFLFSKTIKENITLALPDYHSDEIDRYVEIASLKETIAETEKGYDTIVGERGVTLSGGQKQRLVIARTLIQKPPIVVFDDSLSAVDTETDYAIRNSLTDNLNGATMILISHRIVSVMHADAIMVLENGKINGIGKHDELLKNNAIYQRLYALQTENAEI